MVPIPTNPTEAANEAQRIYERELKDNLEPGHNGKYVIIDIDSGDFELGEEHLPTTRAIRARRPNGNLVALRVGHPAAGRLGFRPRK